MMASKSMPISKNLYDSFIDKYRKQGINITHRTDSITRQRQTQQILAHLMIQAHVQNSGSTENERADDELTAIDVPIKAPGGFVLLEDDDDLSNPSVSPKTTLQATAAALTQPPAPPRMAPAQGAPDPDLTESDASDHEPSAIRLSAKRTARDIAVSKENTTRRGSKAVMIEHIALLECILADPMASQQEIREMMASKSMPISKNLYDSFIDKYRRKDIELTNPITRQRQAQQILTQLKIQVRADELNRYAVVDTAAPSRGLKRHSPGDDRIVPSTEASDSDVDIE